MKKTIGIFVVCVTATIFAIICILLIIVIPTTVGRLTRPKIHEVSSPLETAVVQDLCQKLALAEDDPLCQPGAVVYAPDFFPAVRTTFQPGITTYDDVQEKLGDYQYKKGQLVTQVDGTKYFVCDYDFNGDRVFPVGFFFTDEGILKRVFATVGDD